MPVDWGRYPADWSDIRQTILVRARNHCEGSPRFPDCRAQNGQPHPITGSRVVLTIAHLDHDTMNNNPLNLRALCQRCHLTHDAKLHAVNRQRRRDTNA
jgi:hypothetical protein